MFVDGNYEPRAETHKRKDTPDLRMRVVRSDFFWLPPLMLILGWFRLPGSFYTLLLRGEFVMSAIMGATGIVLWNSAANRRISVRVSVAAYSLATLAILTTFNLYGFIHLSR